MDQEELDLFAKGIQHAASSRSGADLDAALDELGWRDALVSDPAATVATVFEQQGASGTTSSALGVVMASALGVPLDGATGVVLPAMGQVGAPMGSDGVVRGVGLAPFAGQPGAVVPAADGAHLVDTAALELRTVDGMDPRLDLVEISGSPSPIEALTTTTWPVAVAAGQRALAHELVGVSRTMLSLAREHAVDRVQFDRPIAGFQAVRHRLADSLVAIEAADAAAHAAWDDGTPLTAALAKAIAGRNARLVARHAQQILAGIGFTTEHSLHGYVRRALVLDHLLGDARSLTASLGAQLLRDRRLPTLLPL